MRSCADPARRHGWRWLCLWALLGLAGAAPAAAAATTAAPALTALTALTEGALTATPRAPGTVPTIDAGIALQLSQAAVGRQMPDVALLDSEGRPVRLSSFLGKPLLVSFIYTGCFQVCPTQTRALHEAVKGLDRMLGEHQFNVISIGFNQPFDSPDAMRSFARQQRIGYRNWAFLSPRREALDVLTRDFGFSYVATPAGFDHLLGVTVVDANGRIHAQVYGDRLRADQLGIPLRQLLSDQPVAAPTTLTGVIDRVRILCTVYDPDTGEYRYDYKLIFEIIGGVLFFLSALVYGALEWRNQRRARRRAQTSACTSKPSASGSAA